MPWLEIAERGFNFAEKAPFAFSKASEKKLIEAKREIFSALGWNYTLLDGKLTISLDNLLVPIRKAADIIRDLPSGLEPPENQGDAKDLGEIYSQNPCLLAVWDVVGTLLTTGTA